MQRKIIDDSLRNSIGIKRKNGQRWSHEVKQFALVALAYSPGCYDWPCENFNLPSKSTLRREIKYDDVHEGFNAGTIKRIKDIIKGLNLGNKPLM